MEKKWMGSTTCDFCQCDVTKKPWFVDGKTQRGPWALMCSEDFLFHGVGLGTGLGQVYDGETLVKLKG